MTLNKAEKAQVKGMMQNNGWNAVLKFVALKLEQWQSSPVEGKTAFEELRALHKRDGKVEGVKELFDQLEKNAFDA